MTKQKKAKRIELFLEFLFFGLVVGITEDLIAVAIATGEPITLKVVVLVILVAFPFAVLGEIVVDRVDFSKYIQRFLKDSKE